MADEIKNDAKLEQNTSTVQDQSVTSPTAEVDKTDSGVKDEGKVASSVKEEKLPWHEDERFKKFIAEKKGLEEAKEAYESLANDPDFATFLAFKRQKEQMAKAEEKVDFSQMSAEEYAQYIKDNAREVAREEYERLVEANKSADQVTNEAIKFAEQYGIDKASFEKQYGPQIVQHYQEAMAKIGEDKIDAYILAHPPKEVFKSLYFDKAQEAGVNKYKQEIETAKKASFEPSGVSTGSQVPKDFKSQFETNWEKLYGKTERLPESALKRG